MMLLSRNKTFFSALALIALTITIGALTIQGANQKTERVLLGIDVLERQDFKPLWGKRVGLLTHPAGVNSRGESTIAVLRKSNRFRLIALFGPEHGIYGNEKANVPVEDRIDPRTGLPVYSLYGKFRKPTPKMLNGIDVLVVDLQDIGTRSYTYVSCMRYAMEACFENGVAVIILDRPNPLGGQKVDGPVIEKGWLSYVGAFRVPYVHGLTIGELAKMAHRLPGWLAISERDRRRGQLTVIPMRGWRRSMLWSETGLKWIPTSPYIPNLSAVLGYPMTGLGTQIGSFRHGIGSPYPFRLLSHPEKTAEQIRQALRSKNIPGLDYKVVHYRGSKGSRRTGLYLLVKDWRQLRPTEVSFYLMQLSAAWSRNNPFAEVSSNKMKLFNKHVGSSAWWEEISNRGAQADVRSFFQDWQRQSAAFKQRSRQFWLYP